jgi:hypothetical protein
MLTIEVEKPEDLEAWLKTIGYARVFPNFSSVDPVSDGFDVVGPQPENTGADGNEPTTAKRKRRTKAEIAADEARAAVQTQVENIAVEGGPIGALAATSASDFIVYRRDGSKAAGYSEVNRALVALNDAINQEGTPAAVMELVHANQLTIKRFNEKQSRYVGDCAKGRCETIEAAQKAAVEKAEAVTEGKSADPLAALGGDNVGGDAKPMMLTTQDARDALMALSSKKDVDVARRVLTKFKAKKVSDIAAEQIADLIAACVAEGEAK